MGRPAGEARNPGDRPPDSTAGGGAAPIARRVVRRAVETAGEVLSDAVHVGERLAELSKPARARAIARTRSRPIANLYEVHRDARFAPRRELGLMTVPVARIRGTAVEGGAQRGIDFLPLPAMRSRNWKGRWQRIRAAQERLAVLPPIEVLQTWDGYWVLDGPNRVAAALRGGQDEIDAVVTHVHLPGEEGPEIVAGPLAAMLAGGEALRAAGAGRLTPGASLQPSLPDGSTSRRAAADATRREPTQRAEPDPTHPAETDSGEPEPPSP